MRARGVLAAPDTVVLLVDDLSEERRVDAVRRDFVVNVSHELKTPVGALALLAEAISSSTDDTESMKRFADRMQVEAGRLTSLINDLTQLSRLQSDEPLAHAEMIDIRDVVRQAVDDVRVSSVVKSIEVQIGDVESLPVYGERDQLVMALRNLLTNAIAYSEPSTRVAVGTRTQDSYVLVDVKDQGTGIAQSDIDRIFERFYRVDPARSRATGGTGLGLAIVKHVCLNHGGECRVWSEVGVGSTFTLALPLQAADGLLGDHPHEGTTT
jgi:two-component system sensor histidine kinase SenX3